MGSQQQERRRVDLLSSVASVLKLGGPKAPTTIVERRYKGPPPRRNRLKEAGAIPEPTGFEAPRFEPATFDPPVERRVAPEMDSPPAAWRDPQETVLELSAPRSSAKEKFITGAGNALDALFDAVERTVPATEPTTYPSSEEPILDLGGGGRSAEPTLDLGAPEPELRPVSNDLPFLSGPVEEPVAAPEEPSSLPAWLLEADAGPSAPAPSDPPAQQEAPSSGLFTPEAGSALDAFFDSLDSQPEVPASEPEVPPSAPQGGLFSPESGAALDAFFDALDQPPVPSFAAEPAAPPEPEFSPVSNDLPFLVGLSGPVEEPMAAPEEPSSLPAWLLEADAGPSAPAPSDPPAQQEAPSSGFFTPEAGSALDAFFDSLDSGPASTDEPDEDQPLQLG